MRKSPIIAMALITGTLMASTPRVVDYRLVCSQEGTGQVVERANELIKSGFQPLGPVSISISETGGGLTHNSSWLVCQTMVKYETTPTSTPTATTIPAPKLDLAPEKPTPTVTPTLQANNPKLIHCWANKEVDNSVVDHGFDSYAVDGFSRNGDGMDCIPCEQAVTEQEKKVCEKKTLVNPEGN